ncbi:MAG: hypothetical protein H7Z72_13135 [Bacteroidetes bacterium]|nr:hypothetical protein [Fibrella sp.]
MISQLPSHVGLVFGLTTALTIWLFYQATNKSNVTLVVLLVWLVLQTGLGLAGFYQKKDSVPPRFLVLVVLPLLQLIGLLLAHRGIRFIDSLCPDWLTLLHVVRMPVEVVLFWLFTSGTVPQLMTFEGRNFDILSGLSAPIVYYFGFIRGQLPRSILVPWNLICLGLLLNIVLFAILSAPSPIQRMAFDQPNVAISYFPFVWLPSVIVSIVLVAHVSALRQLMFSPAIA